MVLCARRDATRKDVDRYLAQIEFTRRPSAEKLASSADFYGGYVKALTPEKMNTWLDCQVYIAARVPAQRGSGPAGGLLHHRRHGPSEIR